jgi:hypothetical protein
VGLWSSIPDEEVLTAAEQGDLADPTVLRAQVQRMLNDARSHSLISNFAGQWLFPRELRNRNPDLLVYPDFDDNVRQAFQRLDYGSESFGADGVFPSSPSRTASLKPRIDWPSPRARPGSLLGPKMRRAIARMTIISGRPIRPIKHLARIVCCRPGVEVVKTLGL